jgi:hypothetical protein
MTIRAKDMWGTANSCSWTKQEGESMIFHQILNRIQDHFRVDRNDVWRWGIYITRLYRKMYCIEIKKLEKTKVVFGRQVRWTWKFHGHSRGEQKHTQNIKYFDDAVHTRQPEKEVTIHNWYSYIRHVHERHQENVQREHLPQTSKDDKRELDNIWKCNYMLDMWILTEEIQRSST